MKRMLTVAATALAIIIAALSVTSSAKAAYAHEGWCVNALQSQTSNDARALADLYYGQFNWLYYVNSATVTPYSFMLNRSVRVSGDEIHCYASWYFSPRSNVAAKGSLRCPFYGNNKDDDITQFYYRSDGPCVRF